MAKKGKMKISKTKRNNQTTNKMRKKGQLKLQRHRTKVQKHKQPTQQPEVEYSSESEPGSGDEFGDMLDDEEQQYLMTRLAKQPQLLSNVPENEQQGSKSKRKKKEKKEKPPKRPTRGSDSGAESELSDSDVEEKYEKELADRPAKRMRALLPIKTKEGLMERAEECQDTDSDEDEPKTEPPPKKLKPDTEERTESDSDSGMDGTGDEAPAEGQENVVTAVELLAARRDKLEHDKLRIGALCSSLLESPEKKLKNLFPILYMMEDRLKDGSHNLHSVRKLAMISAYEVFKDILPEYLIRHQDYSNIKLKKDTLALYKYEKELLEFYKRYLQRLEKAAGVLRKKKGDTRKIEDATINLGLVALRCMCGLLVARPQFNYATNIAQSVVPHLDSRDERARQAVTECCTNVFADDHKGDITLTIVRLINQLVKKREERLEPSALDCLLTLKIRDIDLDAEAEVKHKKKQDEKHKKRIVNLSKKEKKRAKKLKEVERELLETQAQESDMSRRKQLTEVTKTVFHIYFRLLKTAPRSRLLTAALNGLAKFTHVINLEYYSDLVAILGHLISDEMIPARSRLLCVRTVLAILSGAGDALNVDPAKFHAHLYACMLETHAGRTQEDARVILESLSQITVRARRVSPAVLVAFAKRSATVATQLQHGGTVACLLLLHQLAQQSKAVSTLLETSETSGSGRFDPTLPSPEHCNAHSAALYELAILARHYHPTVREAVTGLLTGNMPVEFNKMTPVRVYDAYDGSQMSFKPAIPPPKRTDKQKKLAPAHVWTQPAFRDMCEAVESSVEMTVSGT